jgi:hypothetical protein
MADKDERNADLRKAIAAGKYSEEDMDAALAWCGEKHTPDHWRLPSSEKKTIKKLKVEVDADRKPALVLKDGRTIDLLGCAMRKASKDARKAS